MTLSEKYPEIQAVLDGESEGCVVCGDCLEIMPLMPDGCVDAVITDPPWGANTACNAQRFTRKASPWWSQVDTSKIVAHPDIVGDDKEFDPAPFISTKAILWGANWYARRLPISGGWFIWDKRQGAEELAEKGWPLGEAELAWTNVRGSTRVFRNLWSGLLRSEEKGQFFHPTQKPIRLMQWCIEQAKLDGHATILDPFCGSGTTCVAAKKLGRRWIGIEIDEKYCRIARNRVRNTERPLFREVH